ncbi:unnamed protein product [Rhizopus stolonifer]
MKIHFIIFLAFVTYVASVQGSYTPFYITNPVQNTTFEAGTNVTISWLNGTTDTATTYVLTGEKSTAMQLTGISFNLKGKSGQYIWKVPTQLPSNGTYSLMISYPTSNTTNGTSYSSLFKITGSVSSSTFQPSTSATSQSSTDATSTATGSFTTVLLTSQSASESHSTSIPTSTKPATSQFASTTPNPFVSSASEYRMSSILCMLVLVISINHL